MSQAVPAQSEYPRRYGKYELLERIGEGGMAEVIRARLPGAAGFEKILVIKRILPHLARNPRFVQMFVNEAKLAAQIQHQNVVQVFELGEVEGGELYMAMEYVQGVDLRGILRSAAERVLRIPVWFTVHTIAQVLGGLSYAHELTDANGQPLHVVHRDVTPSNIFVSFLGEVKLADFGVAKAVGQLNATRSGQLKGKLAYMPPEQLHGLQLDARTDVFSLGVVLWECLTQRRLFGGKADFETMLAICEGKREPPSRFNPRVGAELDEVTLRALSPDREQRFGSAREFQAALLESLSRIRPRLLPADVRHVVEVLLGKKPHDPKLGADLPSEALPGPERRGPDAILHQDASIEMSPLEVSPPLSATAARAQAMANPGGAPPVVPEGAWDVMSNAGLLPPPTLGSQRDPVAPDNAPPPVVSWIPSIEGLDGSSPALSLPQFPTDSRRPAEMVPEAWRVEAPLRAPTPGAFAQPLASQAPLDSSLGFPPPQANLQGAVFPPPMFPSAFPIDPRLGYGVAPLGYPGPAPGLGQGGIGQGGIGQTGLTPRPNLSIGALPPSLNAQGPFPGSMAMRNTPLPSLSTVPGPALSIPADPGRKRRLRSGGGTEIDFDERGDAISTERPTNRGQAWAGEPSPVFSGGLPFFSRGKDGAVIGPMSYLDLIRLLERRLGTKDISADEHGWLDLSTFSNLTGLDYLAPDAAPVRNVTMLGTLEKRSLVAILARLARTKATGRLVIMETGAGKVARREIDVIQGAPTFVYSDRVDLQLPALLVSRELIPQQAVPDLIHQVIRTQEPFIDVVNRRLGIDVFQHWPMLMRERFVEIFSWRYGKFAFDASAMLRASTPFTPSLLNVISEGVQRGFMRNELISKLERIMNIRMVATDRLHTELADLRLSRAQETAVQRLLEGRPVGEILRKHPADAHVQLIMAYVLTEMELVMTTTGGTGDL